MVLRAEDREIDSQVLKESRRLATQAVSTRSSHAPQVYSLRRLVTTTRITMSIRTEKTLATAGILSNEEANMMRYGNAQSLVFWHRNARKGPAVLV